MNRYRYSKAFAQVVVQPVVQPAASCMRSLKKRNDVCRRGIKCFRRVFNIIYRYLQRIVHGKRVVRVWY